MDVFGLYEITLGLNGTAGHNYNLAHDLAAGSNGLSQVSGGVFADGHWHTAGISSSGPIGAYNFVPEFEKAVVGADAIHFNITEMDLNKASMAGVDFNVDKSGALRVGGVTDVELNRVLNDPDLFAKTKFYDMDPKTGNYVEVDKNKVRTQMGYK